MYIGVTLSDDLKWSKLSVSLEEVCNKALGASLFGPDKVKIQVGYVL